MEFHRKSPEYHEAKRLLKFLDYFVGMPGEAVSDELSAYGNLLVEAALTSKKYLKNEFTK